MVMDPNGFYDVYGMAYVPWWQRTFFLWVIGIIGGMTILLLCVFLIKKLWAQRKPLTPWDKAIKLLYDIQKSMGAHDFDAGQFYDRITDILKNYLIARYRYDLAGKTDAELVEYIQVQAELPPELLPALPALFERATAAKFAAEKINMDQAFDDFNRAVHFVRQTIPTGKSKNK